MSKKYSTKKCSNGTLYRYLKYSILFVIFSVVVGYSLLRTRIFETMETNSSLDAYIQKFKDGKNRMFPFRYFEDNNGKILPFVAVTGPFRGEDAKNKYFDYKKEGVHVFGITAYKSFPRIIVDGTENKYEIMDQFDYVSEIKNWCTCFRNDSEFGFTPENNTIYISESDFYDVDEKEPVPKKYDFIYICNKDNENCPLNGWNSVNRNFNFALAVFPIMIKKYKLKGLVVGRVGCGLEKEYGDQIEVTDFLKWGDLQDKMRESRFLFLPNVNDASPRVIAECMVKDLPVLMNYNILGGWKYINEETGEFFKNEYDFEDALNKLLDKQEEISPKEWWSENYGKKASEKRLRDFLEKSFPGSLENVEGVRFIL